MIDHAVKGHADSIRDSCQLNLTPLFTGLRELQSLGDRLGMATPPG
jgi:hypothetical protein